MQRHNAALQRKAQAAMALEQENALLQSQLNSLTEREVRRQLLQTSGHSNGSVSHWEEVGLPGSGWQHRRGRILISGGHSPPCCRAGSEGGSRDDSREAGPPWGPQHS